MINGKAKVLKKKKKPVVNDAISSKVSTLHPKPNTLLDIYREKPFSSTILNLNRKDLVFVGFVFFFLCLSFYTNTIWQEFTGYNWEGNWKKVSLSFTSSPSWTRRLQALPGGRSHSAGFQGSQDAGTGAGRVSRSRPRPAPSRGLFVGAAAQTLFPPSLPHPRVLLRRKGDGALHA